MREIGFFSLAGIIALYALMLLAGSYYPNAYIGHVWGDTFTGHVSSDSMSFYFISLLFACVAVACIVADSD